jgi:hypothetical protein
VEEKDSHRTKDVKKKASRGTKRALRKRGKRRISEKGYSEEFNPTNTYAFTAAVEGNDCPCSNMHHGMKRCILELASG